MEEGGAVPDVLVTRSGRQITGGEFFDWYVILDNVLPILIDASLVIGKGGYVVGINFTPQHQLAGFASEHGFMVPSGFSPLVGGLDGLPA